MYILAGCVYSAVLSASLGLRPRRGRGGSCRFLTIASFLFPWSVSQIPNRDGACRFIIYTKGIEDRIEFCKGSALGGVGSESYKEVSYCYADLFDVFSCRIQALT